MQKQLYFVSGILVGVIMILATYVVSSNAGAIHEFNDMIDTQVEKSGRPEIVVQTERFIIVQFSLEDKVVEYKFYKDERNYEVRDLLKLEDSTKSVYHKEPYERLKEAIEYLEQ